ncbi:MAG: hypothetical protein ACRD3E_04600 [Terriglobales bacterium]
MRNHQIAETDADNGRLLTRCMGTERDRRNRAAHLRWTIIMSASWVTSAFVLKVGLGGGAALKWAIAAVPIALLVPTLLAYLRFVREADELVRKIEMEGVALGFSTGTVLGISYIALAGAGLPRLYPSMPVAIMVAVMLLSYGVGRVRASKRYR